MKAAVAVLFLLLMAETISSQIPHAVPPGTTDAPMFITGNDLMRKCQSSVAAESTFCIGYVVGVIDTIGALEGTYDKDKKTYWRISSVCVAPQVESGQVKDVVTRYLVAHPEKRDQRAGELVILSFLEVWKCPALP